MIKLTGGCWGWGMRVCEQRLIVSLIIEKNISYPTNIINIKGWMFGPLSCRNYCDLDKTISNILRITHRLLTYLKILYNLK